MAFVHIVEMDITEGVKAGALQEFLSRIPETASVETAVTVIPKDRPFESERRTVVIKARWIEG